MIESRSFTGRVAVSWRKKLNPLWWFGNDAEQRVEDAPWYKPHLSLKQRRRRWAVRNPVQNLRAFVIGLQDKNYTVTGRAPVMTVQRNDLEPPERGWQWCVLYGGDLWMPRFFVSYSGRIVFYFGWQPSGFFGTKLNLHSSRR